MYLYFASIYVKLLIDIYLQTAKCSSQWISDWKLHFAVYIVTWFLSKRHTFFNASLEYYQDFVFGHDLEATDNFANGLIIKYHWIILNPIDAFKDFIGSFGWLLVRRLLGFLLRNGLDILGLRPLCEFVLSLSSDYSTVFVICSSCVALLQNPPCW